MKVPFNLHDFTNPLTQIIVNKTQYAPAIEPWACYFNKPASPIMHGIIDLHDFIMIYLVFIVFFVIFMLSIILKESTIIGSNSIKQYYKVKSVYNIKFDHHTLLETIWIIIPSLILFTIAIPSFIILYAMDIIPDHDFSIKVIGHQWYWSYEYLMNNILFYNISTSTNGEYFYNEDEFLHRYSFDSYMIPTDELQFKHQLRLLDTTNPLVIPVGRYASLTITSTDVIHAFAVPALGIKVDAVPGRLNTVALYIMELGHYYGQCSELCGVNHGFMPIEIYCVDLVGFSIYKAALASKIIELDITSTEIDIYTKRGLIAQYYWNFYITRSDKHKIYFKRMEDYLFLTKITVAANLASVSKIEGNESSSVILENNNNNG